MEQDDANGAEHIVKQEDASGAGHEDDGSEAKGMSMTRMGTDLDKIATSIAGMNRKAVKRALLSFDGRFKMDFSEEYLESLSLDRLRHILLAAKLQQGQDN